LEQGAAALLACCGLPCAAAALQGGLRCFASGARGAPARQPRGCARQASDPEKPWKSVVFKMPRKKPERVIETEDDAFTKEMRVRLKALDLKPDANVGGTRGVNEAKIDDLIGKEADDAKINGLYAMWYIDRKNDQLKAEANSPDKHVMRKRYEEQKHKLLLKRAAVADDRPAEKATSDGPGFLELTNVQDIDRMIEEARARPPKPRHEAPSGEGAERPAQDSDVVEYLTAMQLKSQREDKGSKRVVKSKEQRREDYEETKVQILATTAALGASGTVGFAVASGVDAAFSFGLGSLAALAYLSGLSSYTDNADNPMGMALGGRRFLAPILLVLLVEGWDRVEARIEPIAALGLHPQLLPAIFGLLMYSAGKVLQGLLPKGLLASPARPAER